ncbi:MAG: NADH-ubiquinone oxidoreductase chain C, partial [uncultured Acidimicrobiales bacterium]
GRARRPASRGRAGPHSWRHLLALAGPAGRARDPGQLPRPRRLPVRRRLPGVCGPHGRRLPHAHGAPAPGRRAGRAVRGGGEPAVDGGAPAHPRAGPGARGRPPAPVDLPPPPHRRGHGTGDLRHVRHRLHRPPGPVPHPHARRLGGPPAAQGLRHRPHPGPVQGGPTRTM